MTYSMTIRPRRSGHCQGLQRVVASFRDRARQPPHRLPLAHPARRRHEPVQVRRRGARPDLQARRALRLRLSGAHLRAVARPHRSADRGARGLRRRSRAAAADARAAPRCGPASAPRASVSARASPLSAPRACAPTPNARGALLEEIAMPDEAGVALLRQASETLHLSARGFHRTLRVARTLADLDGDGEGRAACTSPRPSATAARRCASSGRLEPAAVSAIGLFACAGPARCRRSPARARRRGRERTAR